MALSTWDLVSSFIAVILGLAILAETIIVTRVRFNLTEAGQYDGFQRAAYATVSTIIASLITAFITSCLRNLWVARIDELFVPSADRRRLQGKWSVILAVGSLLDICGHFEVQLTYLVAALITTSIVASLTPTPATRDIKFDVDVAPGLPWRCAMVRDESDPRYSVYEWQLPNGSYLAAGGNWAGCPSRWAVTLMGGINFINASQYAYTDLGVAVKSTAIGAPVSIYGRDPVTETGTGITGFLSRYGSNVINTTQCVLVMVSNPVSCSQGGRVTVNSDGTITATSDDGLCSTRSLSAVDDTQTGGLMAKGICATGEPGQATIVLGGINAFARWLAVAVNDPDRPFEDQDAVGYRYAITCKLDARDVFRYREVTLSLLDSTQVRETNMGRQLNGGRINCKEFDPSANLGLLATAISANWQPLAQNDGMSGWFDSINQMTIDKSGRQARPAPYAFANSQNALDDTLGLVIALATARINGTSEATPATGMIINTRVGSGKLLGLAYAIPPFLTTVALLALLLPTLWSQQTSFSSRRLSDIAGLGWLRDRGLEEGYPSYLGPK